MPDEPTRRIAPAPVLVVLFQALHFLGVALCVYTLMQMWEYQALLRLMLSRLPLIHFLGGQIPFWILLSSIAAIGLFGLVKIERLVWKLHRRESIEDAPSQLRSAAYAGMGLLCFCIFVLSTPESFSGPFRLRHPIAAWIAACFAYAIWSALPSLKPRFSSRARRRLDIICLNVTLTLILAEVTLRILSLVWASPLLITESTSSQIRRESERMQPGTARFMFPINSFGHYDTEFLPRSERSRPLVITIGDSFSYGVVPHYYHYTTVAEREFPDVEIYNMGFPGTNPADYLYHLVEEALPLEPDLVVISLFVGNDIIAEAPPAAPTQWYDADNYLLGIVWHRLQILRRTQNSDWTQKASASADEDLTIVYPWLTDPLLESPSLGEETFLELESRNAYIGAANHPGVYERFFAALQKIEEAAGDVPLAFLIIPDEYQVNDQLWQVVVERNELPLQRDLPQVKIREWAQAGNRDIVDLLPLLLAEEPLPDGQRHLYHLRDSHFNARGNAIAGRALAKLVEAKFTAGAKPEGAIDSPQEASPAVQNDVPRSVSAAAPSLNDEATEILRQFGLRIAEIGLDGSKVYDESLLDHPKDEIITAVVNILNGEVAVDQQAFAREAVLVLAFFQPNVGQAGVAIDSKRSDQVIWRSVVEAEMAKNNREIASRTQSR